MIGSSIMQSVSASVDTSFQVIVSPSEITTETPNGAYTSPIITVSVSNGTGPFTYNWFWDEPGDIAGVGELINPTTDTCYFVLSGFDRTRTNGVFCQVVDTGSVQADSDKCEIEITYS